MLASSQSRPYVVFWAACLAAAMAGTVAPARPAAAENIVFPDDAGVVNVKTRYGAKGDGVTDDTAAIQKAIVQALEGDYRTPRPVYLSDGTYLISDSLKARITDKPDGQGGWCDGWRSGIFLVGQSREGVVLRLKDRCDGFVDAAKPRAMVITGSTGHGKGHDSRIGGWGNEAFQNYLVNFTVDTGRGNAGAVGVDFLASNRGSMDGITIRSGDPDRIGACGLDMSRPWPGPALVTNVSVDGFDVGIRQKHMDCSMAFEHVTLTHQRVVAIEAESSPTMSMRGIVSRNAVPVFRSVKGGGGLIMFLDSSFTFTGKDAGAAAIRNADNLMLKNCDVDGYATVVDNEGKRLREDLKLEGGKGTIKQFLSREPLRLLPGPEDLPSLPVKDTPVWHSKDLGDWANVADFGAHPKGTPREFTSQVALTRVDPKVDFGWGGGGPDKAVGNDNFSVRWTGQIVAPATGQYTFHVAINDQARLWIDGKLILDKWDGYHSKEYAATATLQAGQRVPIRLDYWESGHDAWIRLAWSGPGVKKAIIPTECLYPTAEARKPGGLTGQYYGSSNPGCAAAIQKAIDSGKSVVYVPNGRYDADGTIVLRGKTRKLIGMEADLAPAQHKLSKLLTSGTVSLMLSQSDTSFDLQAVMDTGKILLVDLATIGSEVRGILGCFLLSLMHLTALGRSRRVLESLAPFHIYCDEAHRFVTDAIEDLVAETRKFHVSLVLAHQYMRQFASGKTDALSSVGSTIIFNVDTRDAHYLRKDLQGLVEVDDLITLEVGQAIARIGNHVVRLQTTPPRAIGQDHCRNQIIAQSRAKYYRPVEEVRREIPNRDRRWSGALYPPACADDIGPQGDPSPKAGAYASGLPRNFSGTTRPEEFVYDVF